MYARVHMSQFEIYPTDQQFCLKNFVQSSLVGLTSVYSILFKHLQNFVYAFQIISLFIAVQFN